MSAWFYDADVPSNFTAAGGVAGLGEIADAAAKQMRLVDNTNSSYTALHQAYDDRIAAVHASTGQKLENPLDEAERDNYSRPGRRAGAQSIPADQSGFDISLFRDMPGGASQHEQSFVARLQQLEQQYPDKKDTIRADVPIGKDAADLAKKSDEDLGRLMASRTSLPGFAAAFYGGFKGSMNDPNQLATMFLGAGAGAGRTAVARIANVALKEALINGAVEAGFQPQVQAWREAAGLPHGFAEAAKNVLFAAGAGGLFGAGAETIGAVGRKIFTGDWLDKAADHAAATAPLRFDIKKALSGDTDKAIAAIAPIREALPPEARAAIDLHETMAAQRAQLPDASAPVVHEKNMDAALRTALDPETHAFEPQLDQQKIDRIVAELVPDAAPVRKSERASLQDLLIRAGGVQDQKGELSALGLQNTSQRFKGRLVKDSGKTLDDARELAAEAGFFNHKYGTADEAVSKSTIADLLDELDIETRRAVDGTPDDNGRSYVEARVAELMRQTGPEVDEKLIAKAVQLAEAEKIDPLEAFDRVALAEERSKSAVTFKTEKGSSYTVDGQSTTRTKAARSDPGHEGDFGKKEPSAKTIYIDTNASELSAAGLSGLGSKGARVVLKDGKASLVTWNKAENRWGTIARDVPFSTDPQLGRYPLELWRAETDVPGYEAFSKMHAGNKITEIGDPIDAPRAADPLISEGDAMEPDAVDEEAMFTPDDLDGLDPLMDIPFFDDGRPATGQQIIDDLQETDWLFQVTEACKA